MLILVNFKSYIISKNTADIYCTKIL